MSVFCDDPKVYFFKATSGGGAFVIGEFGWKPRETGITLKPVEPVRTVPTEELYDYERFKPEGKYALGLWRYSKPRPRCRLRSGGEGQPTDVDRFNA